MALDTINIGTSANDGTGDPLRTAFTKINTMFTELYGTSGEGVAIKDDTSPQLGGTLDTNGFDITSTRSNEDIVISPSGTGGVVASAVRIAGTTLSSDDSALITVAEGLQVNGATNIDGAVTATSTMGVTGATTLSSTLSVSGATTILAGLTATSLTTNTIVSNGSNAELSIQPSGTGDVLISALRINGTTLDSSDSSKVTIAEAVDITGATDIGGALTGTSASFSTTLAVTGAATFSGTAIVDNITINDSTISSSSNADINITPGGTGNVVAAGITINGTSLSAADSSSININEGLIVDGTGNFSGTLTTAAITASGNITTTGNMAPATFSIGDLNISSDGTITTDSNGDLNITTGGTGSILITTDLASITGTATVTGQLNADNLRMDSNTLSSTDSNGSITLSPNGTGNIVLGSASQTVSVTGTLSANDVIVSDDLWISSSAKISSADTNSDINILTHGTGKTIVTGTFSTTGSALRAIHTFTATDAITEVEHAGRTLLLGEVGGNANVVLTLPDATGSGNIYHFIVSVAMGGSTTYKIQVPDANNTISGQIMYLDEDGTAVTAYPTVSASDTITLNSGTQGGLVGDTLTLIDIAADKWHVNGQMRVSAGANPATPFSAAVS